MEAGKHVLCEKPIGLDANEARSLVQARERTGRLLAEAFMVRFHPQWRRTRELVGAGAIGRASAIQTSRQGGGSTTRTSQKAGFSFGSSTFRSRKRPTR